MFCLKRGVGFLYRHSEFSNLKKDSVKICFFIKPGRHKCDFKKANVTNLWACLDPYKQPHLFKPTERFFEVDILKDPKNRRMAEFCRNKKKRKKEKNDAQVIWNISICFNYAAVASDGIFHTASPSNPAASRAGTRWYRIYIWFHQTALNISC